jgi:hypothetical protein
MLKDTGGSKLVIMFHSTMKKGTTFDRAIAPSKLIALFLAVNKSSAHPEMSSSSQGRFFRMYSSVSSSHSVISFPFNAKAGKIAESRSEEKCGETSRHPCNQGAQTHQIQT